MPATPDDPLEQAALIDQALALGPDAVVIAPVHPTRVDEALRRVHAAGVPIFSFVNPALKSVAFAGSDDYTLGAAVAERLYRHLEGRGVVLVVSGPEDSASSAPRVRGFRDAAQGFPDIRLGGPCVGFFDRVRAKQAVTSWSAPFDAVLAANDAMALGALDALPGRTLPTAGVNAIPEAIKAIQDGRMLATADFDAMSLAALATECAIRHLRGERVPAKVELPVQVVDRANCNRWDLPFEQRPLRTLEEVT